MTFKMPELDAAVSTGERVWAEPMLVNRYANAGGRADLEAWTKEFLTRNAEEKGFVVRRWLDTTPWRRVAPEGRSGGDTEYALVMAVVA